MGSKSNKKHGHNIKLFLLRIFIFFSVILHRPVKYWKSTYLATAYIQYVPLSSHHWAVALVTSFAVKSFAQSLMWMQWYDLWSRKKLPVWPHMWHWWITWRQPMKLSLNRLYVTIDQGNNLKSDMRNYKHTTLTFEGNNPLYFSLWRIW